MAVEPGHHVPVPRPGGPGAVRGMLTVDELKREIGQGDMELDPVPGYEMANWEKGYGDFGIAPDLGTLRRIPWLDSTAVVLCNVVWATARRWPCRRARS